MGINGWRGLFLVAAMALVGTASFQGSRGLYESTEGWYAECTREMQAAGTYDVPILNGEFHWSKPPLTYWAILAGTRVLGENPWGVRAFLIVVMTFAAGSVWWAGRVIGGPATGFWAGVVFTTSPYILGGAAQVASTDLLTVLWVAAALAAFWHGAAHRSPAAQLLTWVFLGMGMMTKGPPALLVPAVSLPVAWWFLKKEGLWSTRWWRPWAGIAVFLLIGGTWYLYEASRHSGLLAYWLGDELVGRNLRNEFDRDRGFQFVLTDYLPILLLGSGPWFWLTFRRGRLLKSWLQGGAERSPWLRAVNTSLAAGMIIPFVLFAFSTSKMPLYLAPLFVPLSLILGRMVARQIAEGRLRGRTAGIWAAVLLATIIAGKAIVARKDSAKDMTRLSAITAPVLERLGNRGLYAVSGQPKNGLEFHLRRLIDCVPIQSFSEHVAGKIAAGEPVEYLVSKSEWFFLKYGLRVPVHTEPLGRHWLLVIPEVTTP